MLVALQSPLRNLVIADKKIIKLTVTFTSNLKIRETVAINILQILAAEITIIKIARITAVIKTTTVIKETEATEIEMTDGMKTGTIIHRATKEGMKNTHMVTGAKTGFFITGLIDVTEIKMQTDTIALRVYSIDNKPAFMRAYYFIPARLIYKRKN